MSMHARPVPARSRLTTLALVALGALGLALAPAIAAPERTDSGKTLVVPSEHMSMGEVYFAYPGKDAQVSFASDAPLEHIKGNSASVVGYAVWNPDTNTLEAGMFVLPVDSMDTGIPLRNEHMQGERWLHASEHPDITFKLTDSTSSQLKRQTDSYTVYELTLIGEMTVKGETRNMRIPASVTLLPESDATRSRAPGDLMAIRADYEIELSEFGISDRAVGLKIAETLEMETRMFLSTVSPDESSRR